jgi:molecular chaperone DnaK
MRVLGIDLGTTNTAASIENRALPLTDSGSEVLPSVVAFLPNGRTQIGPVASRRRLIDTQNTIFSSKRIIGRRWQDTRVREFWERYPFQLVEVPPGIPAFITRAGDHTATDIAKILLSTVVQRIGYAATELTGSVVTVPAGFSTLQRKATLDAARQAGLKKVRLVDEPTAAVHAYMAAPGSVPLAAVYDLGGGTFDFSVIDCRGRAPRLLAFASDLLLGGDDIDLEIANWAAMEVLERYGWDLTNYSEVRARLVSECEQAKVRLSSKQATIIDLSRVDPDCPAASQGLMLEREEMDRLCDELVRRTFVTCDHVLANAGIRFSDLDAVLLAGGSTLLPMIQKGVEAYFGKPGRLDFEPTQVVALGASLAYD